VLWGKVEIGANKCIYYYILIRENRQFCPKLFSIKMKIVESKGKIALPLRENMANYPSNF
jgi:hypothetical protein